MSEEIGNAWYQLACAVVLRAIQDVRGSDPTDALDALVWFLGDGLIYLQALDITMNDNYLEVLTNGQIPVG